VDSKLRWEVMLRRRGTVRWRMSDEEGVHNGPVFRTRLSAKVSHETMRVLTQRQRATLFAPVIVLATVSVGYPQVPKAEDIAACNAEAQRAVKAGRASGDSTEPTAKDHSRAAEARSTKGSGQAASGGAKADDPQIAGMNAEGAKNPEYQAAYRTCMRKAGF
jgi:hypothetical protein